MIQQQPGTSDSNDGTNKAIKIEVVEMNKNVSKGGKRQEKNNNKSQKFQETIQLCCLTMTSGPGTSFADFQIPSGARCSVCGSGLKKSRE